MRILKSHANWRISFLTAEKSMREPYIGDPGWIRGCLTCGPGDGKHEHGNGMGKIYLSEPEVDPTLFGGVGMDFAGSNFMVGDSVILPIGGRQSPETHCIAKILGSEQLRLKNPFKAPEVVRRLTAKTMQNDKSVHVGTSFKVAPHIDQSKRFNAVFDNCLWGGA